MTTVLTAPLENLRDAMAATDSWQSWTDTEAAAAAEAFVHLRAVARGYSRPLCLLMAGEWAYDKVGAPNNYAITRMTIKIRFEDLVANIVDDEDTATEEEVNQAFDDLVAAVLVEVCAEGGAYIDIDSVRKVGGNRRPAAEQIEAFGNLIQGEYEVEFNAT